MERSEQGMKTLIALWPKLKNQSVREGCKGAGCDSQGAVSSEDSTYGVSTVGFKGLGYEGLGSQGLGNRTWVRSSRCMEGNTDRPNQR